MRKTFKWNDGDSFTVDFNGQGDGYATFSSGINQGCDRSGKVSIVTTKGRKITRSVVVNQVGLREPFTAKDGIFRLATGDTFNVLKQ